MSWQKITNTRTFSVFYWFYFSYTVVTHKKPLLAMPWQWIKTAENFDLSFKWASTTHIFIFFWTYICSNVNVSISLLLLFFSQCYFFLFLFLVSCVLSIFVTCDKMSVRLGVQCDPVLGPYWMFRQHKMPEQAGQNGEEKWGGVGVK